MGTFGKMSMKHETGSIVDIILSHVVMWRFPQRRIADTPNLIVKKVTVRMDIGMDITIFGVVIR